MPRRRQSAYAMLRRHAIFIFTLLILMPCQPARCLRERPLRAAAAVRGAAEARYRQRDLMRPVRARSRVRCARGSAAVRREDARSGACAGVMRGGARGAMARAIKRRYAMPRAYAAIRHAYAASRPRCPDPPGAHRAMPRRQHACPLPVAISVLSQVVLRCRVAHGVQLRDEAAGADHR